MLIHPLQAEEFMNIVSGKTGTNMINVDKVFSIRKAANYAFETFTERFIGSITIAPWVTSLH